MPSSMRVVIGAMRGLGDLDFVGFVARIVGSA
jgi:hypothetical protein